MNLAAVAACQALQQFGKGALGAMSAVHKGRNYHEAHVRGSNDGPKPARPRP
jgi:hypothetical protein